MARFVALEQRERRARISARQQVTGSLDALGGHAVAGLLPSPLLQRRVELRETLPQSGNAGVLEAYLRRLLDRFARPCQISSVEESARGGNRRVECVAPAFELSPLSQCPVNRGAQRARRSVLDVGWDGVERSSGVVETSLRECLARGSDDGRARGLLLMPAHRLHGLGRRRAHGVGRGNHRCDRVDGLVEAAFLCQGLRLSQPLERRPLRAIALAPGQESRLRLLLERACFGAFRIDGKHFVHGAKRGLMLPSFDGRPRPLERRADAALTLARGRDPLGDLVDLGLQRRGS